MQDTPNLFRLATKELSQDAFFAWLLQWADSSYKNCDIELNEIAKDFIRLLIDLPIEYEIIKVAAGRQWKGIDIWAEVNDEYFIGIEDKTNTVEHSGQLERYKELAEEHYKAKAYKLIFIYLKTGNESYHTQNKIKAKGYSIIDRKAILNIFSKREIKNDIFKDFKYYLSNINDLTNSYLTFENINTDWYAAQGFFLKLQELINAETHWEYVPNPNGGFLGFWYHYAGTINIGTLYIQIENFIDSAILRVVIKIGDWKQDTATLYKVFSELLPYADKYDLVIEKPSRFKSGNTSTVAVIKNVFETYNNKSFTAEHFVCTLKRIESMLNAHSLEYSPKEE